MARIRYLKPDFFKDDDIKNLPFEARLFFEGLWCFADKEGRLEDRPERLKVEIMPYDNVSSEEILQLLSKPKPNGRPFIVRYQVEGESFMQILSWEKHQTPHHTEKNSVIPPPPNGYLTVKQPLNTGLKDKEKGEEKLKEKDKYKEKEKNIAPSGKKHPLVAAIDFDFETRKWKGVTEQDLGDWQVAFPACNIESELSKMACWLLAHPEKRKKKYRAFITRWLSKTQDRGGK